MSRNNLISFATIAVPIVCFLLAIGIGGWSWHNYDLSTKDRDETVKRLALANTMLSSGLTDLATQNKLTPVALENVPLEPIEYGHDLHWLMQLCNVKFVRMEPKGGRDVLAPIGNGTPPKMDQPPEPVLPGNPPPPPAPAMPSYTMENLPLGTKALTTTITVRGPYPNVRMFLWRLAGLKLAKRAVNINDASVGSWSEKTGTVDTKLTVTRFIKPEVPLGGGVPGQPGPGQPAPGAATDDQQPAQAAPGQPAMGHAPGQAPPGQIPSQYLPPPTRTRGANGQQETHQMFPGIKEANPTGLLNRQK